MWSHLQRCQKEIYEKLKATTSHKENAKISDFLTQKFDEQEIADEMIASIMIRRNESYRFVEDPGVQQLFKKAYPHLKVAKLINKISF